MLRTPPFRRRLGRWARAATAAWIAVVQLVLVLAPLSEIPDGATALRAPAAASASGNAVAPRDLAERGHTHNEATCPACIARSLHARLEVLAPLPVVATEQRTPTEAYVPSPRPADPPSSNLSRAPPIA
jgi:hypothetical protein